VQKILPGSTSGSVFFEDVKPEVFWRFLALENVKQRNTAPKGRDEVK
jgi:hypothetical protein